MKQALADEPEWHPSAYTSNDVDGIPIRRCKSAAGKPDNPSPYATGIGTRPLAVLEYRSSTDRLVAAGKTQTQVGSHKGKRPPVSHIHMIPRSVVVVVRIHNGSVGSSPRMV